MKKDDIRTFVTIAVICTLIVGIVLIVNRKSNSEKLEEVNEYNTFFTITSYINNYISSSSNASKLYDLTYTDYINKNNITENTINEFLENYTINSSVNVTDMKYVKIKNNYVYYVKGKIYQNIYDGSEVINNNYQTLVLVDFDTLSYAIYPIDTDYKKVLDKIKKVNIENNKNNDIKKSELITKEQICVIYLSDFVSNINENIGLSYNNLSKIMKERFPIFKDYEDYINNNIEKITSEADKCLLENVGKNRVYTVIDKNGNKYTFTEKNIMNYEVNFYLKDNNNENE